jgi:hypothetical protein
MTTQGPPDTSPGCDCDLCCAGVGCGRARELPSHILEMVFPHVWDVDGKPRGVVHRLEQRAETLVARDYGIDETGARIADIAPPVARAFADVVHVMQNATTAEWRRIADRGAEPDQDPLDALLADIDAEIARYASEIVRELAADNGPSAVRADCARRALVRLRDRIGSAPPASSPLEETLRGYIAKPGTRSQGEVRSPAPNLKAVLYGRPIEATAHLAALSQLLVSLSLDDAQRRKGIDDARTYLDRAGEKVPREIELDGMLRVVLERERRVVTAAKRVVQAASLRKDDPLATEHGELEHALER